jgi:hypothetical protein
VKILVFLHYLYFLSSGNKFVLDLSIVFMVMYRHQGKKDMDGKAYYNAAILLTDKYHRRFADMMDDDSQVGDAMRGYFTGEFRELDLYGWNQFCRLMTAGGQGKWLDEIQRLDEATMLNKLERQMFDALDKQDKAGRDALDAATKAIQGLVGKSKFLNERNGGVDSEFKLQVEFFGSAGDPITGLGPEILDEESGGADNLAKPRANGASKERTEI